MAASVFFETFTLLAVGSAVAAAVLIIWHPHQLLLIAAAVGVDRCMLGIPTVPACFRVDHGHAAAWAS